MQKGGRTLSSDDLWPDYPSVETLKRAHGADRGFSDASFPTAEVGYVTDLTRRLFKTEDGGRSWRWLPAIRSVDVAFATPQVGYVHGPDTLYRTEDGGQSWQQVLVPLPKEIQDHWPGLLLPQPGVVDATPLMDAVLRWYRQTYGKGQPPVPGVVTGIYHRITPISESAAWAYSQDQVFITEDGGRHWTVLGSSWERTLWAVARLATGLWYAAAGYDNATYRSVDDGHSWHRRGMVGGVVGPLAFPAEQVGYTTGPIPRPRYSYGYGLFKTEDAGTTWRRLPTEVPGRASCLVFTSEQVGFVAGERGILMRTVDGGETWTHAELRVKPLFERLLFPTPEVGYAVGSRCTMVKTMDAGESWTVLTHGAEQFEKALER